MRTTRIPIPVVTITRDGVIEGDATVADSNRGHTVWNPQSRTWLEVTSTDDADQTVAFQLVAKEVDGVSIGPRVVTVPAGKTAKFGFFPRNQYDQPEKFAAEGFLSISADTPVDGDTVTIGARTYTFRAPATGDAPPVRLGPYDVLIADTAAATVAVLANVIQNDRDSLVFAEATDQGITVVARTPGDDGNQIAIATTSTKLNWNYGDATLIGGLSGFQHIYVDPSVSTTLQFRAYSI